MKILDCEQRSADWHAARLGRVTSSCAAEMLATRKDKSEAAGRRNLRVRLALERITNRSLESSYQSDAMRQGTEREADAVSLYEVLTGSIIRTVGFVCHDDLMAGASPDGYVGEWEGLVEAKSPLPATHWEYVQSGVVPGDYLRQVQHQLFITGAGWCDWISYCPEFPEPLRMKCVRIERDDAAMRAYGLLLKMFLKEVDAEIAAIEAMAGAAA